MQGTHAWVSSPGFWYNGSGMQPGDGEFLKLPRRFWCAFKIENQYSRPTKEFLDMGPRILSGLRSTKWCINVINYKNIKKCFWFTCIWRGFTDTQLYDKIQYPPNLSLSTQKRSRTNSMVDMIILNNSLKCLSVIKGCLCNLSHLIWPQLCEIVFWLQFWI